MAVTGNILSFAREVSVEQTIIRADGRREPLGRVAYWHRNPFKRWAVNGWRNLRLAYDRSRTK